MSVFKYYLGQILGTNTESTGSKQVESGCLLLYYHKHRSLVGKVLTQHSNLGLPGPYLPHFYQLGPSTSARSFAEVSTGS